MKNKTKKINNRQIVEEFIGELEHFVCSDNFGGWPLKPQKSYKELCKLSSAFFMKDDRLHFDGSKLDPQLEVELWKFKYEEVVSRFESLYSSIKGVLDEH